MECVILGVSLIVLLLLLLSTPSGRPLDFAAQRIQQQQQQQQQLPPLVCSHQILGPPPLLPGQETLYERNGHASGQLPQDGSLDAMTSLWLNAGVTCFDVDVIVLGDGNLLAVHPRRLQASLKDPANPDAGIHLEDYDTDTLLGALQKRNNNNNSSSSSIDDGATSFDSYASTFPFFDTMVLPHFATLVHGIPGAFSEGARPGSRPRAAPWDLGGPLLNIDLKQGPHLTKERVTRLLETIHELGLEAYVAICATADVSHDQLDLLQVVHEHNTKLATTTNNNNNNNNKPTIPVGLVLRDLVPEDANVVRVREVVQDLYPESIKALIPSFKFSTEWYRQIRKPSAGLSKQPSPSTTTTELWKLPMTVWTIDSREDYRTVSSITTGIANDETGETVSVPMASAVVANRPMELRAMPQPR
jgi:hypothetical protein